MKSTLGIPAIQLTEKETHMGLQQHEGEQINRILIFSLTNPLILY